MLFFTAERGCVESIFHALFQPAQYFRLPDVHIFNSDGAAIGLFQAPDDLLQACRADTNFISCLVYGFQITVGEAKIFMIKRRCVFAPGSYRVSLCKQVSALPVCIDEVKHFKLRRVLILSDWAGFIILAGKLKTLKKMSPVCSY